jgi:hypothetical protein
MPLQNYKKLSYFTIFMRLSFRHPPQILLPVISKFIRGARMWWEIRIPMAAAALPASPEVGVFFLLALRIAVRIKSSPQKSAGATTSALFLIFAISLPAFCPTACRLFLRQRL